MKNAFASGECAPLKTYNLIVCGGGVAGCAAAVTAAKRGMSVLLLEKSNILGGLATLGQVNYFVPMCNGRGKQILFGLAEKWLRDSAKYGYDTIPDEWKNGEPAAGTETRYHQRYSPYIFALQLTEEILSAGVDLLYDCMACEPVMEGNLCRGVTAYGKEGACYYACDMLIDVTGDCDLLRRGGVPCVPGENYFSYFGKLITLDRCREAVEKGDIRRIYGEFSGGNINLFGHHQPQDVPRWSGLSSREVTDYLVRNQMLMLEKLKATAGERKRRDLAMLPLMPQFRTTCRIRGDETLSVRDVYRHAENAVCAINDFEHRDGLYEVPLGALCRRDHPNMLTAGRSASGEGYAWDILRVIPPAIITGQCAAEAACLAIESKCGAAEVDLSVLRSRIEQDGIMVRFPDEYIPKDRVVPSEHEGNEPF